MTHRRCSGHRLESHADAETYRHSLAHLRGVSAWRWVSYECGQCGGWHVGQARKRLRRDSFAIRCAQAVGVAAVVAFLVVIIGGAGYAIEHLLGGR